MSRRKFIAAVGGAAAWPLGARAQQPAPPVIGFLNNTTPEASADSVAAFQKGLSQAGYRPDQTVVIDFRWGHNDASRLPELAKALVQRGVSVIVASGGDQVIQAVKAETTTIPVVATIGNDPVESGLVRTVNRPDGNITGISVFATQLVAKRLELARELAPGAKTIAFLQNQTNPNSTTDHSAITAAANDVGQEIVTLSAATTAESDAAFAELARYRSGAVIVESDPFFNGITAHLVQLATHYAVPVVFPRREFALAGGLMSYGSSLAEAYHQIGIYTGRILKGDKPADLPILFPTRFELVVNLKAAKALGIQLPTAILLRADEVIE